MTAAHATLRCLTGSVERVGHKIHMGNFFSSLDLMTCTQDISTVVRLSNKECLRGFHSETLTMKWGR